MYFVTFRCDPDLEDCPSACEQPQATTEWTTFFNYLDITDQVRIDEDDTLNNLNLIDQPQRDSASVEDGDSHIQHHPPSFDHVWSTSSKSGPNLGRDIHWTVAHGRIRRDTVATSGSHLHAWNDEEVTLYCSNFLVNSTVALECGNYLDGTFIMKAIQVCIEGTLYCLNYLIWD